MGVTRYGYKTALISRSLSQSLAAAVRLKIGEYFIRLMLPSLKRKTLNYRSEVKGEGWKGGNLNLLFLCFEPHKCVGERRKVACSCISEI